MTETRQPRRRVALVDPALADCDRLDRRFGRRLELALVVAPAADHAVARWAEVGGYPWTADLGRLSAVVADVVAVGGGSPRRAEALALAALAGMDAVVLEPAGAAGGGRAAGEVAAAPRPGGAESAPGDAEVLRLEDAFAQLFGPPDETGL